METPVFRIQTGVEKKDFRRFLYIATFFRSAYTPVIIAVLALVGAYFITRQTLDQIRIEPFVIVWLILVVTEIGAICFRVEYKNKKRIKADSKGELNHKSLLLFYKKNITLENLSTREMLTMEYEKIEHMMESKGYFIFYFAGNTAALVRKEDVEEKDQFREFIVPRIGTKYRRIRI